MKRGGLLICLILAAALLAFGGCGGSDDGGGTSISRDDMPANWPFTVDSGTISCEGEKATTVIVFTDSDGEEYGLNRTAVSEGYAPIDPIREEAPVGEGIMMSTGPLTERAYDLCE